MSATGRYLLAEYAGSRRWVAPGALFVVGLVVLYAEPPNPVFETAGGAAAFLTLVQAWLAITFLNSQADEDRHIIAAAVGPATLTRGRLIGLGALCLTTSILAVALPWLGQRFATAPTAAQLGLILVANAVCTAAGSAMAALFAAPTARSRALTVLGITTLLVVTVPIGISPATATANALDTTRTATAVHRLLPVSGAVVVFVLAAAALSARLWRDAE